MTFSQSIQKRLKTVCAVPANPELPTVTLVGMLNFPDPSRAGCPHIGLCITAVTDITGPADGGIQLPINMNGNVS